ncbi:MAG: NAD(P)-dependent glycerol-3-phosphate dehydrogenase [Betaproteobacteria bacterium]|nr:NAD(P)-dependent glycerol-3-phosphate dehydrogenase [Betaproteobacteria bacterium]
MTTVAILGAGAWGTALAVHLAQRSAGQPRVRLWTRDPVHAAALAATHANARYLPGVAVPETVLITAELKDLADAELLFVATPVAALPAVVAAMHATAINASLVTLCKGFVASADLPAGVGLAHQLLAKRWMGPVAVVSGPSFADEVARGMPTALSVASADAALAARIAALLRGGTLRAYESDDVAGVEVGGAIKNVLAIAAGASDGLGFGHNARAALITRGLAETGRLSLALGGRRETLMGLSGLGDLVLTCTSDLSRNRRVGLALAKGRELADALAEIGHVAEGVASARAARALGQHFGVDMPICEVVDRVLHERLPVRHAVKALLKREPRPELI